LAIAFSCPFRGESNAVGPIQIGSLYEKFVLDLGVKSCDFGVRLEVLRDSLVSSTKSDFRSSLPNCSFWVRNELFTEWTDLNGANGIRFDSEMVTKCNN